MLESSPDLKLINTPVTAKSKFQSPPQHPDSNDSDSSFDSYPMENKNFEIKEFNPIPNPHHCSTKIKQSTGHCTVKSH